MIHISKFISLVVLLSVCFAISVQSQVTIGNTTPPLEGLLLDLKQDDVNNGGENADMGMRFPCVALTAITDLSPISNTADVAVKETYTGTVVYNVTDASPFEEGLYIWDGALWVRLLMTKDNVAGLQAANNGLSISNDNFVQLGGDLLKNTVVDLDDYDLTFSRGTGRVGIGTASPVTALHVNATTDPFRVEDMKKITDPANVVEPGTPIYHNLVVSNTGDLKQGPALSSVNLSDPVVYRLASNYIPANGQGGGTCLNANGSNPAFMSWRKSAGGTGSETFTVQQSGVCVVALRFYGSWQNSTNATNSFYLAAWRQRGGSSPGSMVDKAEIVVNRAGYGYGSYFVTLSFTVAANDIIRISMVRAYDGSPNLSGQWTLRSDANTLAPNVTSMLFWVQN